MSRLPTGRRALEQGRIGPWQMAFLFWTLEATQDSTGVNRLLTQVVGRDLWLSILLAAPFTALGVLALCTLARRFPGQDLAGLLLRLLGPAGYVLGLVYVALFLASAGEASAEFTSLSHQVFVATPPIAFLIFLIGSSVYVVVLGLEVTARVNTALLLFVDLPLGVLLTLLFVGQQHLANVLPVLADGVRPVLWGALLIFGSWAQFVLLLVLLPATKRPDAAARASLWSVPVLAVMALGHNLGPVLVFGDLAGRLAWPTFMQIRVIDVGRFIERLDVAAIWLWVHGFWLMIALYLYASGQVVAGLFGVRRNRRLALPLGLAVMGLAMAVPNQSLSMRIRWDLDAVAYPILGFAVPLVLLCLSTLNDTSPHSRAGASVRRPERLSADRP